MNLELRASKRNLLLWVTVLSLVILLAPGASSQESGDPAVTLDLNRVVELALEHDLSAKIAAIALEEAEISYERSRAMNLLSDVLSDRLTAENAYRLAKISHENRRADVVIRAVDQYFTVLADQMDVGIKEDQLEAAETRLASVRRKVEIDSAGPIDLRDAEIQVRNARLNLEAARLSLDNARESLARMIGLSPDASLSLDGTIHVVQPEYDLEAALEASKARSSSLINAKHQLNLAEIRLEETRASDAAPLDVRSAELAVERAKLEYEQALRTVTQNVEQSHAGLMQAWESLQIQESRLALEKERYDVILRQYEAGLTTESQRLSGDIGLAQTHAGRLGALKQYVSTLLAFQKLIGEPVGLSQTQESGEEAK